MNLTRLQDSAQFCATCISDVVADTVVKASQLFEINNLQSIAYIIDSYLSIQNIKTSIVHSPALHMYARNFNKIVNLRYVFLMPSVWLHPINKDTLITPEKLYRRVDYAIKTHLSTINTDPSNPLITDVDINDLVNNHNLTKNVLKEVFNKRYSNIDDLRLSIKKTINKKLRGEIEKLHPNWIARLNNDVDLDVVDPKNVKVAYLGNARSTNFCLIDHHLFENVSTFSKISKLCYTITSLTDLIFVGQELEIFNLVDIADKIGYGRAWVSRNVTFANMGIVMSVSLVVANVFRYLEAERKINFGSSEIQKVNAAWELKLALLDGLMYASPFLGVSAIGAHSMVVICKGVGLIANMVHSSHQTL